jgi:hypothetical protein
MARSTTHLNLHPVYYAMLYGNGGTVGGVGVTMYNDPCIIMCD